jgi:23S rRNA pseudouridine2457 synthase
LIKTVQSSAHYILFNKPYRLLPSFTDPDFERGILSEARATLADYIPLSGVYAAGRLDYDSEGLLFLTDDGQLSHQITHPDYHHPKTYWVQIEGTPEQEALARLRQGGIPIKNYRTAPAKVRLLSEQPPLWPRTPPIRVRKSVPESWLELTLTEGKKRQIRRMTAAVGHPTLRLVRVAIGSLKLGTLQPGEWREASHHEMRALREMLGRRGRKKGAFAGRQGHNKGRRGRRGNRMKR